MASRTDALGAGVQVTRKGETMKTLVQVNHGSWCQESYETGSGNAGRRARSLRKLGYTVTVSPMGSQVTSHGTAKLTLVDISPGANHFDTLDIPCTECGCVHCTCEAY